MTSSHPRAGETIHPPSAAGRTYTTTFREACGICGAWPRSSHFLLWVTCSRSHRVGNQTRKLRASTTSLFFFFSSHAFLTIFKPTRNRSAKRKFLRFQMPSNLLCYQCHSHKYPLEPTQGWFSISSFKIFFFEAKRKTSSSTDNS